MKRNQVMLFSFMKITLKQTLKNTSIFYSSFANQSALVEIGSKCTPEYETKVPYSYLLLTSRTITLRKL